MSKLEVTAPVFVQVGPVDLRLYPYSSAGGFDPDSYWERPWAWWAMVKLTFTIGSRTTTKRVKASHAWHTSNGRPQWKRPSDWQIQAARDSVLTNLRDLVALHGFDPPEFTIHETRYPDPADLVYELHRHLPTTWTYRR